MGERICSIEGCGQKVIARGLCRSHYGKAHHRSTLAEHALVNKPLDRPCCIEGCDKPVAARDMCPKHYSRWRAHGDPSVRKRPPRAVDIVALDGVPAKRCTACGVVKPLVEFNRFATGSGGRESRCRVCYHAKEDRSFRYTDEWRAKQRAYQARKRAENPEQYRGYTRRRRNRRLHASVTDLTAEEWLLVREAYGGRCAYCGAVATAQDHLVPLSRGGGDTASNVVPACRPCNSRKKDRTPDEWAAGGGPKVDLWPHPFV